MGPSMVAWKAMSFLAWGAPACTGPPCTGTPGAAGGGAAGAAGAGGAAMPVIIIVPLNFGAALFCGLSSVLHDAQLWASFVLGLPQLGQ